MGNGSYYVLKNIKNKEMAGIKDIEKVRQLITTFVRFLTNLSVGYTIYYKHYYGINFSSKVYSKSLLKVESLKGSVVYSLILDYQFCASVMRV